MQALGIFTSKYIPQKSTFWCCKYKLELHSKCKEKWEGRKKKVVWKEEILAAKCMSVC
jgi:hypothetical protein